MQVNPELWQTIRSAINDSYYDARNTGRTMDQAADDAAHRVAKILEKSKALVTTEDGVPTSVKVV
jgi:hypothetical protein